VEKCRQRTCASTKGYYLPGTTDHGRERKRRWKKGAPGKTGHLVKGELRKGPARMAPQTPLRWDSERIKTKREWEREENKESSLKRKKGVEGCRSKRPRGRTCSKKS